MIRLLFVLNFLISARFCWKYLAELQKQCQFSDFFLKILASALVIYFFFGLFLQDQVLFFFLFYLFPLGSLISSSYFLQKKKQKHFLESLYSLLSPTITNMRLGLGFMDAWQKNLATLKQNPHYQEILKISEILRFQKNYSYENLSVKRFLHHLMDIRKHPQALKKLRNFQKKIKVEVYFLRRSKQVLFQLHLQSLVLSLFYAGLLFWNIFHYGFKHLFMLSLSLFLFSAGLIWIFKSGEKLKWSL